MVKKTSWFLLLGIVLAISVKGSFGQTATLTGTVTDATGGVVPGAKVTATQMQQNIPFGTVTDDTGRYLLQNLPIGTYTVQSEAPGFRAFRQSGVQLTVDSRQLLNIQLEVGAMTEVVDVHGEAARVDTVAPTLQQLVDARRTVDLPLNGRNVYQLIALVPGAVGGGPKPSINGSRVSGEGATFTNFRLDGALNIEQGFATVLPAPPPDAVQEFTIQTSMPSAKHMYSAGTVEVVTKSGTNELHGAIYEFFRNDALDARNFFASNVTKRKRNQFGVSLGGPVRVPGYDGRNRTFWFFSWEKQREPLGAVRTLFVPTAAQKGGDFSGFNTTIRDPQTGEPFPDNMIPPDRLDPLAQNLMDEYVPLPLDDTGRLTYAAPADTNPTQVLARVDHTQGDNLFTWRSYLTRVSGPLGHGNLPAFSAAGETRTNTDLHTITWTRSLNPQTANVFRFSYLHWRTGRFSDFKIGTPDNLRALGWSDSYANGVQPAGQDFFPWLFVGGFMDFSTVLPLLRRENDTFTWEDDITLHRGRHNLQLGLRVLRTHRDTEAVVRTTGFYNFTGQFTSSPLTDFMLGLPSSFEQQNLQAASVRQTTFGYYIQDDIKIGPRFSLNLGLRYDLPLVPIEDSRKALLFLPGSTAQSTVFRNAPPGLLFPGDPGVPEGGHEASKKNFGPRIGLVYALTSDQKTVLRAGYGIFYNPNWVNMNAQFHIVQPFVNRIGISAPPSIADPWANFPGGNPFPSSSGNPDFVFRNANSFSVAPGYADSNAQQWNLNLQREIAKDYLVTVAYVGTKGTHLGLMPNVNAAEYIPGVDANGNPLSTLANLNSRRPFFPPLTSVLYWTTGGNSSYHSFQVSLDKRFSRDFSLLTSYTGGKSIDIISDNFVLSSIQDPNNFGAERAISTFDRTHTLATSWVWRLPKSGHGNPFVRQLLNGWQSTGIFRLSSGTPFGVFTSIDAALRGTPNRPHKVGDPQLSGDLSRAEKIAKWFDTGAYAANGPGEFGTAPRTDGQLRGPGFVVFDLGILKDFSMTERHRLQFRAEFFNLPNRPNFGNPQTNFASGAFGRITSAGDPRIIQFALKYLF